MLNFFDDRQITNAWIKSDIQINPNIIQMYINNYFNIVIKTVHSKICEDEFNFNSFFTKLYKNLDKDFCEKYYLRICWQELMG